MTSEGFYAQPNHGFVQMSTTDARYERLDRILRGDEGDDIRSYDQDIESRQPSSINLILTSRSSRLPDIGPLIITTDREIRRAVTIFESGSFYLGEPGNRPPPLPANYGGLEVTDAAVGSLHMLLTAYGKVQSLLISKPIQALTAAITIGQGSGSIRLWRHRKKDPLAGISARQALEVLKAFDGDSKRFMERDRPDLEIEIQQTEDQTELFTYPDPDDAIPVAPREWVAVTTTVNKSGDIIVRGRRITYIRNYPDGTQDIIYVDG